MSDEPLELTVDASGNFGKDLIFVHQGKKAVILSPKQAGLIGRQLIDVSKPGTIGRDDFLMKMVAEKIHKAMQTVYEHTKLYDTRRGYYFELMVTTSDGEATGRVARVTVELDRVEENE